MADAKYNSFKKEIADGTIDLVTDTIKCMLVTATYTPDIDLHTKRSDITNEVVGTGYVLGGEEITTRSMTQDDTNDLGYFDGDDVTWSTSTITARGAVLYKSRGGASSADELIGYWDFGSDKVSTAADFTIAWDATGILSIA